MTLAADDDLTLDTFVDALDPDRIVPCECCESGVSITTGAVCVACDGTGWRYE